MATTYSQTSGSWTYRLYVNEASVGNAEENYSRVTCEMRIYRANGTYSYIQNGRYSFSVTINGVNKTSPTYTVNKSTSQPEVSVGTLSFDVPHNEDGTGTASITYCQFISSGGTSPDTATMTGMPKNFPLTTIARNPLLGLKRNGAWVYGKVYVKVNGAWVKAKKIFIKNAGSWKEDIKKG